MGRKPSKAVRRLARYQQRKQAAETGRQLLDAAWDLMLAALTGLAKADPAKADGACRDLAHQLETVAIDIGKEEAS
jgi:RNA polymerase-interacting CarD/CdnL/TRCF family regulator